MKFFFSTITERKKLPEIDLGFVISARAVNADENFSKMKNIIKEIYNEYIPNKIRYSIIVFGDLPSVHLSFGDKIATESEFVNILKSLRRQSGGAALDKALEEAMKQFDSQLRLNARRVLVVMVDGKSTSDLDDVKMKARQFEEIGVQLIAISVGDPSEPTELQQIIPREESVIIANKSNTAKELAKEVIDKVIKGRLLLKMHLFCLIIGHQT